MKGVRLIKQASKFLKQAKPDYKSAVPLLQKAYEKGNVEAGYALGTWYFHGGRPFKKDEKKGFTLMLEAANNNYAAACYDVGVSYELGQGTRENYKKAFEYYLKGHLLGDKQSMYEVGRCYHFGI